MAALSLPAPEYLRQRLRYDPETGKLYWRGHESMSASWNARWDGRGAFTARNSSGYLTGQIDARPHKAHRIVWAIVTGAWPEGHIDHIDHDKGNNRFENLRDVSRSENARNMPMSSSNTSGVTGVGWYPKTQKWRAHIDVNGRSVSLGHFARFDDAVAARVAAETDFAFHSNHGRNPQAQSIEATQ